MSSSPDPDPSLTASVFSDGPGPRFVFRSTHQFEWTQIRLPIPNLPAELAGFRLVHLSDIHARGYWSTGYNRLIRLLEESRPDLLLVTGDFMDDLNRHRPGLQRSNV